VEDIACVLMRGGSSKGLFFLASDLPEGAAERDRLLLAAMGSPDVRQIDGMGGGNDQSSKVVIVAPSRRPEVDVEQLFAQVSVARDFVDVLPNSGNMTAAVAPFAIESGLVRATSPETLVRILNINSGKIVEAVVQTPKGRVTYGGPYHLDGVPGTSAPIRLNFLDPAGTRTGRLLPTSQPRDVVAGVTVTCIDFAIPLVLVKAESLGMSGHESQQQLNADGVFLARLEEVRTAAGQRMGLELVPGAGLPKIAILAAPRQGGSIASRYFAPGACHAAYAISGALALAAACHVPDTIAEELVEIDESQADCIEIEHPSGRMECCVNIAGDDDSGMPVFGNATIVTSARPLLSGRVLIPSRAAPAISP
jgi:4-oxalomesaconate tautomerase